MAAPPAEIQQIAQIPSYCDYSQALKAFGITEVDLEAHRHLTDTNSVWLMELIPPYATTSPALFQDHMLQKAVADAAEFLRVPRTLVRHAMKNPLPVSDSDPYKDEHPINHAVFTLHKMLGLDK